MKTATAAAWGAIAGALAALVLLASLHSLSPEFDPSFRMVSEYANGSYGWVLSLMFAAWGLSSWALALALWPELTTRRGRIGLAFLVLAGLGELLAAFFDINNEVGHSIAGALGLPALPIAALLISRQLGRSGGVRWLAHITWLSLVLLIATFVLMTITFLQAGGDPNAPPPKELPAGVIGLVGWANRFLVLAYCLWVIAAAWYVAEVRPRVLTAA